MAQRAAPFLAGLLVLLQQLQRQADQVVEVHRRIGREPLLVELHHPGGDALVVVLRGGLGLLAAQAVVLPQADGPLPAPRHRRVGGAAGVLQHAQHVVGVQDRELRLQAEHLAVLAQHAHAQAVEGGDHQILRRPRAHQRARPLAHFLRRLVGEGDRADLLRGEAGLQQPGDLVRDHPRLARARARQHQTGAVQVVDGFELGGIEGRGGVGHGGAPGTQRQGLRAAIIASPPRPGLMRPDPQAISRSCTAGTCRSS